MSVFSNVSRFTESESPELLVGLLLIDWYRVTTPRVRHYRGPPFPRSGIGVRVRVKVRVRVRRTVGMADPGNGGPESADLLAT